MEGDLGLEDGRMMAAILVSGFNLSNSRVSFLLGVKVISRLSVLILIVLAVLSTFTMVAITSFLIIGGVSLTTMMRDASKTFESVKRPMTIALSLIEMSEVLMGLFSLIEALWVE